ncbi:hypothetical protein LMK08_19230 [Metapseudomonas furukawaii]|uniref:hypothetical protein n=1 Tax=Metapseudomonas furukawaii TaxID=1149133 RepID=UPI00227A6305|nr:hypothetical protein [Pseudomonas furukawaii]WAG77480.1 hypothetical protein LMK08_19230 [Pseudomonas furukawaii]
MKVPGFCPVRQQKDGGNDGFVAATGTYYQVYSPQRIHDLTIKAAALKLIDDFDKLAKNWHYLIALKKYVFVLNDKLQGVDADVIRRVKKMEQERGIATELITSGGLEDLFHQLDPVSQERLITRHANGRASLSALKMAAKFLSAELPIAKWEEIDEQVSYECMSVVDLEALSRLVSKLFSMTFLDYESSLINNLVHGLSSLVDIFNAEGTMERNSERGWDNTWKSMYCPHPDAAILNQKFEQWQENVRDCCVKTCKVLNDFASYVRLREIPDYLDYQSYTVTRRLSGSLNEYIRIIP